jgi:DNA-binding GntR family transcriptional regulator
MTSTATRAKPAKSAPDADDGEIGAIERVTNAIVHGIRAGQLVPGQHLVEADLTRRYGISRGSLREALKQMAAQGIVTLNRHRGAYIAELDRKGVRDLLDTLEPLCRLAARLAAQHCATPDQRTRLRRIAGALAECASGGERTAYLAHRRQFYDALVEIGGNAELGRVIPLSRTDLFRAQFESAQTNRQRARHASGYAAIAEAVIANDPRGAELAVKRHFEGTRKTLEELPGATFPGE